MASPELTPCSQAYYKKHHSASQDNPLENFLMKEKQFTLRQKKVTVGGFKNMFVKMSPATTTDAGDSSADPKGEMYTEQQFSELRESLLEL